MEVIVFDLDDTLYASREFAFSGFRAVSDWLEKRHFIGGFLPVIEEFYEAGYRGRLFDLSLEHMALQFDEGMIEEMVRVYRHHKPVIKLLPEAVEVLRGLSCKKALITDGFLQTQLNKIEVLGLNDLMDFTLCTDELGVEHWKPSSLAFEKVMDHFRGSREFTYVGDNPLKDFISPNRLGWKTIRVVRAGYEHAETEAPTEEHEAQVRVGSLKEIL